MKNDKATQERRQVRARTLIKVIKRRKTWREVGAIVGVNPGYLSAILSGKRPASMKVLIALGIVKVEKTPRRARWKRLSDIPTDVLAGMIRNREEASSAGSRVSQQREQ